MFSDDTLGKDKILKEKWQKTCNDILNGQKLDLKTSSGIELKPLYTPGDIADMDYYELGLPGQYPYMRGNYSLQYQINPFIQNQFFGFGTPSETRGRRDWLAKLGCSYKVGTEDQLPLVIAMDLPTLKGLDPDEPEARGRVGHGGVSISTMADIGVIMEGLPLDKTCVIWNAFDATLPIHALYFAYALDIRQEPLEKLFMSIPNNISNQWAHDWAGFPHKTAIKLEIELIKFIINNCPNSLHTVIEGYETAEAGATPVQEVAFMLGYAIDLMEEAIKAGLDPDAVAPGLWAHHHLSLHLFEEVAKLRAARKLWAKIFKEKFGCQKPESLNYKIVAAETAGIELTALEPLNNIIRLTIMTLAGVLGGVEGIFTAAYDEALGIPTEESAQIAVRTQQILAEETDICQVIDPLGGSYYIEWLTKRMEEEITNLLSRIEENGGFLKSCESGWVRREIAKSANERQEKIKQGEKVIIGVNKYRIEQRAKIKGFRVPLEVEEKIIEQLRAYKKDRDHKQIKTALEQLRTAAEKIETNWPDSCGILMPALIETSRAGCTLGEMHRVLREVFGYGFYSG
jgi:methylmalonyl-CoA mutase N-terminal domain/subunit